MIFRTLKPDEIECRVGTCSEKGLTLLLYKNARVDMDILDETVGALNWQRHHSRDNANCTVSVYFDERGEWVSKEDTGTESNTEAEKGLASDSFKRACVNWGIGRELYTSPFIWIKAADCKITQGRNGKPTCYDKFSVAAISYDDRRRISELAVRNDNSGKIVFEFYAAKAKKPRAEQTITPPPLPKPEDQARGADPAALRNRIKKITYELAQGKAENIASAINIWTDGMFVRIEDIPDEKLYEVLNKAESIYRKRGGN